MQDNSKLNYDVIVIGGGASGMMAAGRAAERGRRVLLLEKNASLGQKLAISGGGRCNITHVEDDIHELLRHYGDAGRFLYSPFSQFGVTETFSFFEKLGLPLVEQVHKRVFPASERATDVIQVLKRYMDSGNVTIISGAPVSRILSNNQRITGVTTGGITYTADSYVIATGGLSHPETGSTGDGFNWLRELGHNVITPTPTLVPLATKENWGHILTGVSLENMKITFYVDGVKQFSRKGPLLFTHFGLSGPTIINSAGKVAEMLPTGEVTVRIDAYPALDHKALDEQLISVLDANKNKSLKNVMDELVPPGMARAIWELIPTLNPEVKVHSLPREQRKALVEILKSLPITITGLLGLDKAIVVDGGVPLAEIDTKTMRSVKIKNLFVTGDLLNITRPSGGFSLQLCWTTGYVAGSHA